MFLDLGKIQAIFGLFFQKFRKNREFLQAKKVTHEKFQKSGDKYVFLAAQRPETRICQQTFVK